MRDRMDSGEEQMAGFCECGKRRFYKILGISWQAEDLLASQSGLWSMELVSYNVYNVLCVAFEHYVEF
jgi:hypothetical protein